MGHRWTTVYQTELRHHAEIVSMMLSAHGCQAIVLDKRDSAYSMGYIEVKVQPDFVMRAAKLIEDEITF